MSIVLSLYLADFCDSIRTICIVYAGVVGFILATGLFLFAVAVDSHDDETVTDLVKVSRTKLKLFLIPTIIAILLVCVIPSRKTVYLMIGATAAQELTVSETGQKVLKAINLKLDEIISKSEQRQSE